MGLIDVRDTNAFTLLTPQFSLALSYLRLLQFSFRHPCPCSSHDFSLLWVYFIMVLLLIKWWKVLHLSSHSIHTCLFLSATYTALAFSSHKLWPTPFAAMYDYDYDHIFNTSVLLNTSIPTACFWNVGSEHTKLAKVKPYMTKKIEIISKCFGLLYHHHHYHFFVVSSSKCTNRAIASWLVGQLAEYLFILYYKYLYYLLYCYHHYIYCY